MELVALLLVSGFVFHKLGWLVVAKRPGGYEVSMGGVTASATVERPGKRRRAKA